MGKEPQALLAWAVAGGLSNLTLRSWTRKVAGRPRSAAFCFALVIGSARKSMPVASGYVNLLANTSGRNNFPVSNFVPSQNNPDSCI
jgi:hypothetical protein